jgi:predicted pyridoxine 5'-phosphate oxidase superfamily flavin-nucleotide-binding protein
MTQQRTCPDLSTPHGTALEACAVEPADHVATHFRHFAEAASLIALVTAGENGPECQVWGCENCSVRFRDENTLVFTDLSAALGPRWLLNIKRDRRVRFLFVIAGVSCTLRMSGLARLEHQPSMPRARPEVRVLPAIVVALDGAYFRRATASKGSRRVVAA